MSFWYYTFDGVQDVSGDVGGIGVCYADKETDIGSRTAFTGKVLLGGSTCHAIAEGSDWMLDSSGVWHKQPDPHTTQLDISGYYTSAETDTAIASAISTAQTTFDSRYLRIGTGSAITDGTDLNSLTTLGKFRNANANNGCRNMPLEIAGRPFTLLVENTYGNQRYKQTLWLGQSGYTDRFYWRIMTTNNDWTGADWYKVSGTAVATDVPTP